MVLFLDVNECLMGIPLCTNGVCINQQGGFDCICPANFTGDDCSIGKTVVDFQ